MKSEGVVCSADGTSIAFSRSGSGPALVLVEAAGHSRIFSSFDGLTELLAETFTVFRYDRRGRGASSDTAPYAVQREVEDLAALVTEAGGHAFLYGYSSGGVLALHAAAAGSGVPRLAALEPALDLDDEAKPAEAEFSARLAAIVQSGRHEDAVAFFHAGIGLPEDVIDQMRGTDAWAAMTAVAPTLVYDAVLSATSTAALLAAVQVPTLVLDSEGSSENLTGWAADVARGIPNGEHRSLPGEWHGVPDEVLAPVLTEFFSR